MAGQVVGTWRLKVFDRRTADGDISFPLGPDAVGYLAYTPDGYVFISMMRAERQRLATRTLSGGHSMRGRAPPVAS
jgi:lipocalin-like protein